MGGPGSTRWGSKDTAPEVKLHPCLMCGCKIQADQEQVKIASKGSNPPSYHHAEMTDCQASIRGFDKIVFMSPHASNGMISA